MNKSTWNTPGFLVEHVSANFSPTVSINNYLLVPISKKTGNPTVGVTRNTTVLQLVHQSLMGHHIEGFGKI